jgi:hypothetical protein
MIPIFGWLQSRLKYVYTNLHKHALNPEFKEMTIKATYIYLMLTWLQSLNFNLHYIIWQRIQKER